MNVPFTPDSQTIDGLRIEWAALLPHVAPASRDQIWRRLIDAYGEKHRHYHNATHIRELLMKAATYRDRIREEESFRLAIWFHDAVYDTHRRDNEERSALLAVDLLPQIGISPATIASVEAFILATKHHAPPNASDDLRLFLDLDLSILGAPEDVYGAYGAAIRKEYSWVPFFLYRRERIRVLESFLKRPRIFSTDAIADRFETQARVNLANEIADLGKRGLFSRK